MGRDPGTLLSLDPVEGVSHLFAERIRNGEESRGAECLTVLCSDLCPTQQTEADAISVSEVTCEPQGAAEEVCSFVDLALSEGDEGQVLQEDAGVSVVRQFSVQLQRLMQAHAGCRQVAFLKFDHSEVVGDCHQS